MIVFTDLDGSLLDHQTYDYSPALPALNALAERQIPVILASSKTAAEIAALQTEMNLQHWPAIVENGAGLVGTGFAAPGLNQYDDLRATLDKLAPELRAHFQGFGDGTDADVASWTGLPIEQSTLARQRSFTEPGRFSGTADEQVAFVAALKALGVTAKQGGRFLTLSFGRTKADGLRKIAASMGSSPTVALGDAPNDRDMLLAADKAVIIRNDHGPDPGEIPGAIRTSLEGPAGWNAAILTLLQD